MITILLFVALHKPVSGDEMFVLYEDLPGPQSDDLQSQWYRSAGRQIRRLEAIIPGPINAIYSETVAGTAVIRAFGVQSVFISGGSFIYIYVLVHLFDEAEKIGALIHVYPAQSCFGPSTCAQLHRCGVYMSPDGSLVRRSHPFHDTVTRFR